MAETVFFTSDTHFGHKRILELGHGRPFSTVEEMDEVMIDNWNSTVTRSDRVYHLGDVSFHNPEGTRKIIERLKGQIHFIRGNHDHNVDTVMKNKPKNVASYSPYKEIKIGDHRVVMFHFPIESWHGVGKGAIHLHGHCHGNLHDDGLKPRMDVGVDCNSFRPISFEGVCEKLLPRVGGWYPSDHHGSYDM